MLHTLVVFAILASLHRSLGLFTRRCLEPISDGGEYGPKCLGYFESWGFDVGSGRCIPFVYSGCNGNRNRFPSLEVCQMHCDVSRSDKPWLRIGSRDELSRTLKVYEPLNLGETGLLLFNFGPPGRKGRLTSSLTSNKFDNLLDNSEKLYGSSVPLFRPPWRTGTNLDSNENDADNLADISSKDDDIDLTLRANEIDKVIEQKLENEKNLMNLLRAGSMQDEYDNPENLIPRSKKSKAELLPEMVERIRRPPWRHHTPMNLEVGAKWTCQQTKTRLFRPPWRRNFDLDEDKWVCEPTQVAERLFRPPWRKSAIPDEDDAIDDYEDTRLITARLFKESGFTKIKDDEHVPFRERLLSQLFKSSGRESDVDDGRRYPDGTPLFRPPWRSDNDNAQTSQGRILVRAFKSPELYLADKDDNKSFTLKLISRVLEAIV